MRMRVQIIIEDDYQDPIQIHDAFDLERGSLSVDNLGLRLEEAKTLLGNVQDKLVSAQVAAGLIEQFRCPTCQTPRRHKDTRNIVMRTLFGKLRLPSPRWHHCKCTPARKKTFSPLTTILPERTTPELLYLESKFAALISFGLSAKLLAELLPLGRTLDATVLRRQVHTIAERLEDELGPEQSCFIQGCQNDWQALPRPDLPLTVGLDGGYVHCVDQPTRTEGWFEVIAGKSIPAEGAAKCFAFVQTHDKKPKRRLYEVLKAQGMTMNQQITFITDGGEDIRDLPLYLNPQSEHLLDWFHIAMRLTVLGQMNKGQPEEKVEKTAQELERLKWFLWHGNVFRALETGEDLLFDLEIIEVPTTKQKKLFKTLAEFTGYISSNAHNIPNYGELYRAGERITSSFVESAVNQIISKRMVKKQQMRWTKPGAHLLLQLRTRVLNDDLAADFHRWYPNFTHTKTRADHTLAA
jgi:hypothetical protein